MGTPSNSAADLLALRLLASGVVMKGSLVRLVSHYYRDHLPASLIPYRKVAGNLDIESFKKSEDVGLERITVGTCASLGSLVHCNSIVGQVTHVLVSRIITYSTFMSCCSTQQ